MPKAPAESFPLIAAIDLGSNSFHMVLAKADHGEIRILERLGEKVQLAAGLDEERQLSEEAMQRGLDCLRRFGQLIQGLPQGAVRIVGQRILTSQRLELLVRPDKGVSAESVRIHRLRERDLEGGLPKDEAMRRLMRFIGSRPLVGYYLEFDVAMLNRALAPLLGTGLPQQQVEISGMYYDYKLAQIQHQAHLGSPQIDLRFDTLMQDLGLPQRDAHDALNDAVMAALAFIKLRRLLHLKQV